MKRELWNSAAWALGVMLLAVGAPWLVQQIRTLPRPGELAARADQRIVALEVGGMTCSGCVAAVKARIEEVPGVSAAEVRLEQRRAYVVCDKALADTALTAAVERAGPGFMAAVVRQ